MGLVLVLAYVTLYLLSPAEIVPALVPLHPVEVVGLLALPLTLVDRFTAREIGKLRTQLILVMLFGLYACAAWVPHAWFGGVIVCFITLAPNLLAYFMGIVQFRTPFRLAVLRVVLVLVAFFVLTNAYFQLPYARAGVNTPYVLASEYADKPNDVRIRGLGVMHDPNFFGQYLLALLPLLFVSNRKSGLGIGYFIAIPVALLIVTGVYLTDSRGAEMGLVVLVCGLLVMRFKTAGAIGSAIVGSMFLVVINAVRARTISMSGGMDRLKIWSDGMSFFKSSPVWGIGVGGFVDREALTAHNSYLLCAAELGFIGYFLWTSILVVTIIQLSRVPKVVGESNPGLARWAKAMNLSLISYLFTSFFLSRTYDLPLFLLLGMAGAIIVAAGGDDKMPLRGSYWPVVSVGVCVAILTLIYALLRLRWV